MVEVFSTMWVNYPSRLVVDHYRRHVHLLLLVICRDRDYFRYRITYPLIGWARASLAILRYPFEQVERPIQDLLSAKK